MPLNDTLIRGLKAEARARKHFDGGGLFLFIPTSGSKLWRMAYRFEGKSKLLSFGSYPALSLREAREQRDEAKKLLAQGIDPAARKREEHKARLTAQRTVFRTLRGNGMRCALSSSPKSIGARSCIDWKPISFPA